MRKVFHTAEELKAAVGQTLDPSGWLEITQTRIHQFAEATGDHQWIHTSPERARTESPYGTTIAHGYLSLSLLPMLLQEVFAFRDGAMMLNYGLNHLRFPAPLLCGSRVRLHATVADVQMLEGGMQLVFDVQLEADTHKKPVMVAQTLTRVLLATAEV